MTEKRKSMVLKDIEDEPQPFGPAADAEAIAARLVAASGSFGSATPPSRPEIRTAVPDPAIVAATKAALGSSAARGLANTTIRDPENEPAESKMFSIELPLYLIAEIRLAGAKAGKTNRVIVMEALRNVGFNVRDADLRDLRGKYERPKYRRVGSD